ncbi:hypothetical protein KEM48_002991 [Puccinia striiformis f. sp. tritici PST-130]|nr:hypothetical protein KEM48_002991 [Puccinia striiformis f. sp. tritici PST-130]
MDGILSGYGSEEEAIQQTGDVKPTTTIGRTETNQRTAGLGSDPEDEIDDINGDVLESKNHSQINPRSVILYFSHSQTIGHRDECERQVLGYDLTKQGPKNPFTSRKLEKMNTLNGHIEEEYINEVDLIDNNERDVHSAFKNEGMLASEMKITKAMQKKVKRKREDKGEAGGPDEEEYEAAKRASTSSSIVKKQATEKGQGKREVAYGERKSTLHAKSLHDYQGRTYMHVPTDLDVDLLSSEPPSECFLPKHYFQRVAIFTQCKHGLSNQALGCLSRWEMFKNIYGHSKAVRDVTFSNDGKQFLSAGYDRQINYGTLKPVICASFFKWQNSLLCQITSRSR